MTLDAPPPYDLLAVFEERGRAFAEAFAVSNDFESRQWEVLLRQRLRIETRGMALAHLQAFARGFGPRLREVDAILKRYAVLGGLLPDVPLGDVKALTHERVRELFPLAAWPSLSEGTAVNRRGLEIFERARSGRAGR